MPKRIQRKRTKADAAGDAFGFIMACDFASIVARRIIQIGERLDTATIAAVSHALELHIRVEDDNAPSPPASEGATA